MIHAHNLQNGSIILYQMSYVGRLQQFFEINKIYKFKSDATVPAAGRIITNKTFLGWFQASVGINVNASKSVHQN